MRKGIILGSIIHDGETGFVTVKTCEPNGKKFEMTFMPIETTKLVEGLLKNGLPSYKEIELFLEKEGRMQ